MLVIDSCDKKSVNCRERETDRLTESRICVIDGCMFVFLFVCLFFASALADITKATTDG